MTQAQGPGAYVHQGFWTNWSKGGLRGLTITLSPGNGNLLIAVLALFVALAGSQMWTVVRFILHQRNASRSQDRKPLHDQRQVALRNTRSDVSTAVSFIGLMWTNRRTKKRSLVGMFGIMLSALAHLSFFVLAGTFSSNLADAGQAALSQSPFCGNFFGNYLTEAWGSMNRSSYKDYALSLEMIGKREHDLTLSQEYAKQCYLSEPSYYMASTCNTYQQPKLSYTRIDDASCPFDPKVCSTGTGATVFDTGLLDSHSDLGLNAPREDRVYYRRLTNCSALNDTSYTSGWVNDTSGVQTAYAYYGSSLDYNTNWTFQTSNFGALYTEDQREYILQYQLTPLQAVPNTSYSDFVPIPELQPNQADLTLIMMGYTGQYADPVDDVWFSAHQEFQLGNLTAMGKRTYRPDKPISSLACIEQHQICTEKSCTPMLGLSDLSKYLDQHIEQNARQQHTTERILNVVNEANLYQIVVDSSLTEIPLFPLGSVANAAFILNLAVPDNQWQVTTDYWHSISMAHMQRMIVEFGTGQIAAETEWLEPPSDAGGKWLCQNLIVMGTNYQSFSVLVLVVLFLLGSMIIAASLTVEDAARWYRRRYKKGDERIKMWEKDEMIQLLEWKETCHKQKLVLEKQGKMLRKGLEAEKPPASRAEKPPVSRTETLPKYEVVVKEHHDGEWV